MKNTSIKANQAAVSTQKKHYGRGHKKIYKPTEIEARLQVARDADGFVGKVEKDAVHHMVENAKRNGHHGDKILLVVDPKDIHVPHWQRRCDMSNALPIGTGYKSAAWDLPKVLYDEGKLWVVDGMHRIVGAFEADIKEVTVELLQCSKEEAINLFLGQTQRRKRMSPYDYFGASLENNVPEYITFKRICAEKNIQIKDDDTLTNPIGTFTAISKGVTCCRIDPKLFENILQLIIDLHWCEVSAEQGNAFNATTYEVLKKLYAYFSANVEDMEKALKKECMGAEYFVNTLNKMKSSVMFDHLSEIVLRNIAAKNRMLKAI